MLLLRHARLVAVAALAVGLAGGLAAARPQPPEEKKEKVEKKEAKKDAAKKVSSKLKVTVPDADAELKIEGKATKPTGVSRDFVTPDIDAGREYEYAFEVVWRPNNYTTLTRTKSVTFKAGEDVVADLSKPDPAVKDKAVVRWVPTPQDIVDEMIKMAKVTKDDVVYEPGPGDAVVLISAVKAGAKKAVGIELDPKMVEKAKGAVKEAGLEEKVTIIEGDALKDRDYSEASVVFLYMGNEFNALLRPILEKQLKPGTRIVSHRFTFGDWEPDESRKVVGKDGDDYMLHIWTVKGKKDDKPAGKKGEAKKEESKPADKKPAEEKKKGKE